jgi:ketosteroid isomerase-like protein
MKRILPLTPAIVILSALLAIAAASKDDTVQQEIMKIERQWIDASVKADIATLDKIEADDYIVIDPTGTISTKAEDAKNIKSGDLKFDSMEMFESKVRVYGEAAVVTAKTHIKAKYKTEDISGDYSSTDVFIKMKGEWRAVSSHITRVMSQ